MLLQIKGRHIGHDPLRLEERGGFDLCPHPILDRARDIFGLGITKIELMNPFVRQPR